LCMSSGDGISNSAFFIQTLLHELGYISDIYAVDVGEDLGERVVSYAHYQPADNQLLLVHHGFGHGFGQWLENLPDQKVLVYHNISPPEYFSSKSQQADLVLGKKQLTLWKEFMLGAIADSHFNKQDLTTAGWEGNRLKTIPLLVDIDAIKKRPFRQDVVETNREITTLLFVGSFLPHKAQDDLIISFYYLIQLVDTPLQLILAGGDYASRMDELKQLTEDLGLGDSVHFQGKVSDDELYGWYRAADLYVSMSEHEGFGMPLIEASVFDIPVLAYNAAGIADTLGAGGILFREKKYRRIAALMALLLRDIRLRQDIISGQRKNLEHFSRELLQKDLHNFILSCSHNEN